MTELPDFKNGATKPTEATKKTKLFFSVAFVASVTPFLRSGTSVLSGLSSSHPEHRLVINTSRGSGSRRRIERSFTSNVSKRSITQVGVPIVGSTDW